jgi:GNAT superfamily N-acetyltransferase
MEEQADGERPRAFHPPVSDSVPRPKRVARIRLEPATRDDAAALATLHTAIAGDLTRRHGRGPWSSATSERGVLFAMRSSRVFVARMRGEIVATLRLTRRKPWAIDPRCFTPCGTPLYLVAMAVAPDRQRQGLGRRCLEEARRIAEAWPAEAIRLDTYDAAAGAAGFYARCGYAERGRARYRGAPLVYYERLLDARE